MEYEGEEKAEALRSPLKTIRAHCLSCNGSANEVKLCPCTDCKLYPYRFGHSPNRAPRVLTEEQRENMRQTFARKMGRVDSLTEQQRSIPEEE
jgi:hypothetical protein